MATEKESEILRFWYDDCLEAGFTKEKVDKLMGKWYGAGLSKEDAKAFDDSIKAQFGADVEKYANGEYDSWAASSRGVTALCVLGDQFTRNIYRGTGKAFSLDAKTLDIVLKALDSGMDKEVHPVVFANWLLPLMHSEDLAVHDQMIALFEAQIAAAKEPWIKSMLENSYKFGVDHREMIKRFGRYPYRNAALSRTSTPEELEFLQGDVNTYGQ